MVLFSFEFWSGVILIIRWFCVSILRVCISTTKNLQFLYSSILLFTNRTGVMNNIFLFKNTYYIYLLCITFVDTPCSEILLKRCLSSICIPANVNQRYFSLYEYFTVSSTHVYVNPSYNFTCNKRFRLVKLTPSTVRQYALMTYIYVDRIIFA